MPATAKPQTSHTTAPVFLVLTDRTTEHASVRFVTADEDKADRYLMRHYGVRVADPRGGRTLTFADGACTASWTGDEAPVVGQRIRHDEFEII